MPKFPITHKIEYFDQEMVEDDQDDGMMEIHVADIPERLEMLEEGDKIVTTETHITIDFDYPLSNPETLGYCNMKGFTLKELVRCVYEGYTSIYKEEEKALKRKPRNAKGTYNRERTNGPYGIWGHDISDLILCAIEQNSSTDFSLWVES